MSQNSQNGPIFCEPPPNFALSKVVVRLAEGPGELGGHSNPEMSCTPHNISWVGSSEEKHPSAHFFADIPTEQKSMRLHTSSRQVQGRALPIYHFLLDK